MVPVKFLKSHPNFGYFPGQEGTVTQENAEKLLESGHIELLKGGNENPLPEDLPGRDAIFESGLTIEDLKGQPIADLVKIKGIGDATAKLIIDYINK